MAKPLGEKSRKLREAIKAHPGKDNSEIAALLTGQHLELGVKPGDVAAQRQALKKLAGDGDDEDDRPEEDDRGGEEAPAPGAPAQAAARTTVPAATPATGADPALLMDRLFDLARDCGGWESLKRVVDRLADLAGKATPPRA